MKIYTENGQRYLECTKTEHASNEAIKELLSVPGTILTDVKVNGEMMTAKIENIFDSLKAQGLMK